MEKKTAKRRVSKPFALDEVNWFVPSPSWHSQVDSNLADFVNPIHKSQPNKPPMN